MYLEADGSGCPIRDECELNGLDAALVQVRIVRMRTSTRTGVSRLPRYRATSLTPKPTGKLRYVKRGVRDRF